MAVVNGDYEKLEQVATSTHSLSESLAEAATKATGIAAEVKAAWSDTKGEEAAENIDKIAASLRAFSEMVDKRAQFLSGKAAQLRAVHDA